MNVTLSAFGDEIAADLEPQLALLNQLQIPGLELRSAWGTNVLEMTDEQARKARELCDAAGITVCCLGSPVGKSELSAPIEEELRNVERLIEVGGILGTTNIRIFSFYPDDISTNAHYDQYVDEVIDRLGRLTEKAASAGFTLLHENHMEIVGDTPERCAKLMAGVNHPNLRFIWDSGNFVQVGIANVVDTYWELLRPYVGYVHIKDATLPDGTAVPAGEGDGQIPELLARLKADGYSGVLALEPHLKMASRNTGFSDADGMALATEALRKIMADVAYA